MCFTLTSAAGGKGYEEFINRAQQDEGVVYCAQGQSKIYRDGDKVMVWAATRSRVARSKSRQIWLCCLSPRFRRFRKMGIAFPDSI